MTRPTLTTLPRSAAPGRPRRRLATTRALLVATLLSGAVQLGMAQATPEPFARILPDTTIFAVFAQPSPATTAFVDELAAELDVAGAMETMRKLGVVLGSAADDTFDLGFDLSEPGGYDELLGAVAADCPELSAALEGLEPEDLAGRLAAGVSSSAFAPMPAVMALARLDDAELGSRLFEAVTGCYDSGVALSEGGTPFYVLGDGSDFPVIVAQVDGTQLLASDPDVLRGMVRRAGGASEPSLAGTRVGGMARSLTSRGLAFTLDLAGIADLLGSFAPMLGGEPEQDRLIERFLATLRVVNGVAASVTLDEAGLVLDSVVTVDSEVAVASGEQELLDLLNCAGCAAAEPELIPAGPAGLSRSSYSTSALVAWLDSWLADVEPLLGDELPEELADDRFTVAGLADHYLGVDLGSLGLDWLGTTTHVAQLRVYDTDLTAWLQGPVLVTTTPVRSEDAAREGLRRWQTVLDQAPPLFAEFMADDLPGDDMLGNLSLDDLLSVRTLNYRGVAYDRVRGPFAGDYGVAVFGGHLVTARPARAIESVIDVHLGAPSVVADATFGSLLASQPEVPASYQLVDLPRYLSGLAELTDLAAGPLASTLFVATQGVLAEPATREDESASNGADDESVAPADVPSFDELVRLADLATEALRLVAERTGIAIGSSEIVDGVHWSTLRIPLR